MKDTTRENKEKLKTFIDQSVVITVLILFKHKECNEMSFLRAALKTTTTTTNENNEKLEEPTERLVLVRNMRLVLFCHILFL